MSDLKECVSIRVSGVDQDGTAATAAMTSDAIEFAENNFWSVNIWFTGLTVTGQNPEITIEVSNDADANSFTGLDGAENVTVPEMLYSSFSEWRYWRIVYDPKGATGGTKNFDLIQGKNGN